MNNTEIQNTISADAREQDEIDLVHQIKHDELEIADYICEVLDEEECNSENFPDLGFINSYKAYDLPLRCLLDGALLSDAIEDLYLISAKYSNRQDMDLAISRGATNHIDALLIAKKYNQKDAIEWIKNQMEKGNR